MFEKLKGNKWLWIVMLLAAAVIGGLTVWVAMLPSVTTTPPEPQAPAPTRLEVAMTMPLPGSTNVPISGGIELGFNVQNVSPLELKKAVTISPPLEVDVTSHEYRNRLVLFPTESMAYDTEYTVTVAATLASDSGLAMEAPYTFSFRTVSEDVERINHYFTLSGSINYNTLTSEAPQLSVYLSSETTEYGNGADEIGVTLYTVPDIESYSKRVKNSYTYSAYDRSMRYTDDLSGLTLYSEMSLTPLDGITGGWQGNQKILVLPEPLPEGRYVADLSYDTGVPGKDNSNIILHRYLLIQSSDLSVFFMQSGKDMLLWVNDAATGKPVEGATFAMEGDLTLPTVTTGQDGTAIVADHDDLYNENWNSSGVFTITSGDRVFVDGTYFDSAHNYQHPNQLYYSYLFTDRPIYRTTDTINVWGMIKPRRENTPMPQSLTLDLDGADPLAVTPDSNGFFSAKIDLAQIDGNQQWPLIHLMADEKVLDSLNVQIYDYVKPTYTAATAPEQPVYLMNGSGPNPAVSFDISFFDGTPLPGFNAHSHMSHDILQFERSDYITDSSGHIRAVATIDSWVVTPNTWHPTTYRYDFSNGGGENESFLTSGYLHIIHRDLMLESQAELSEGSASVMVDTHMIDISRVKNTEDLWKDDNLRGAATSVPVHAELVKVTYQKTKVGTSYDFINMVSVPNYKYSRVDTVVDSFDFTTSNGSYTLADLPVGNRDTGYYLNITATDSAGRAVETTQWLYPYPNYNDSANIRYGLQRTVDPADIVAFSDEYGYYDGYSKFGDKEDLEFQLTLNDTPVTEMSGQLLYATVQRNIENSALSNEPSFTLPFSEDLLPNYYITGAYFDGKHVFALEDRFMRFDYDDRTLDVAVTTPKDSYQPGETVTVTAKVTDHTTGKPAAGATTLLSVVDEAVFAIEEQYVNFPSNVYSLIYYPSITKYVSYQALDYSGGGEKGGGGGVASVRSDFPDTAAFQSAVTDSQGIATFTVTMPDSLTSWRLTCLSGDTHRGYYGNTKANITVTKDFYVTPSLSQRLLTGDAVVIGLRSAGRAVNQSDMVDYTVTLSDAAGSTRQVTSALREYGWATFDTLEPGDYSAVVSGSCKGYNDAVRLDFSVTEHGLEVARVRSISLSELGSIDSLRYPVTLNIYDQNYAIYNRVFANLVCSSPGQRADMRLARSYTNSLMKGADAHWYFRNEAEENIDDLIYSLISVFPYSQKDVALTSQLHLALSPHLLNAENIYHLIDDDSLEAQPELKDQLSSIWVLRSLCGNFDSAALDGIEAKPYLDQINLAVAAAVSGDAGTARKIYDRLVTPNLRKLTGISGEEALYVPAQGESSESDCTAAASRLAILLDAGEADGFMLYLLQKKSPYQPYIAEQLLYLTHKQPPSGNSASLSYSLNGKTETVELKSFFTTLTLSRNQLKALNPKVSSGEVSADVFYTAYPADASDGTRNIGVTKTITPVDGGPLTVGSLVRVTISANVSGLDLDIGDMELIIDDCLPSGLRYEQGASNWEQDTVSTQASWLIRRQGQSLRFASRDPSSPIVYYARCAFPGDYRMEGAYISSQSGDSWGMSDDGVITILP